MEIMLPCRISARQHDFLAPLPPQGDAPGLFMASLTGSTAMTVQQIEIRSLTPATGAEIRGVDLSRPVTDTIMSAIHEALQQHLMVYFRGQDLTPESFGVFGRRFGTLAEEPFIPPLEGYPGIHQFRGVSPDKLTVQNLGWHVDHSYRVHPSWAAALYAVDVPASGGDTLFANMYSAYDALSDRMKKILEPLSAVHDILSYALKSGHHSLASTERIESLKKMRDRFPQVEHPIVCRHPETGKPYLYVNPCWVVGIAGMPVEEGRGIIDFLHRHTTRPEFQCRLHWENGTVGMWDNRCVLHSPIGDHIGRRAMLRLAIRSTARPAGYCRAA